MRQAFDENLSRPKHTAFVVSNEQLCSLDTHSTLYTNTKMSNKHQTSVELIDVTTRHFDVSDYSCHMNYAAPLPVHTSHFTSLFINLRGLIFPQNRL